MTAAGRAVLLLTRSHIGRAVAWFGVAVVTLLWVAIAWDLGNERTRMRAEAQGDTANLALAFEEHFLRTVAGLDQTLLTLKAEYERAPDRFDLNASMANAAILKRVSVQIGLIGADGVLVDSNVANFARVDLSDREHFRVHQGDKATGDLFVSKPVMGRASGKWSIQLTRRLDTPEGGFAGVLVISLDPLYLSGFYGSFDIGPGGSVLLVGKDGIVRADSAGGKWLGESIAGSPVLADLSAAPKGGLSVAGPLDGLHRITSFRTIAGLPLAIVVGRAETDVLSPYRDTVRIYVLVGLSLTLVLGGAASVLFELVRRQERIANDLMVKKAELTESRERLKRYVADLERIAEVSAHDLQEPLRRVVSYAQLLAKHAENVLDEEGRGYVAQVVQGAHRIRKLVQDLESFVAVDHMPPPDSLTAAGESMAVAAQRMAGDIEAAGATLVIGALPRVAADPRSLAEIFTQLLDNALRYRSPERRPIVQVSARSEDGQAVFSVRDNGIGIDQRHWTRIFEIFHRLHGVDDRNPGTGMGLAIVRRMVERLGGRVWVESEPGTGTTFWFTLPVRIAQPEGTILDQEVQAA